MEQDLQERYGPKGGDYFRIFNRGLIWGPEASALRYHGVLYSM